MKLRQNHEIVGILKDYGIEKNQIKLVFTAAYEVELAAHTFSDKQLKAVLGKRIGIFNHSGRCRNARLRAFILRYFGNYSDISNRICRCPASNNNTLSSADISFWAFAWIILCSGIIRPEFNMG